MIKYLLISLCLFAATMSHSQLFINEVMSSNSSTIQDEVGEYDDWIEIYNSSSISINLDGYYLSDKDDNPTKFQIIGSLVVAPNDHVIIWADEDGSQGNNHANFKISGSGEFVMLTDPNGVTVIDSITVVELLTDQSYGRVTDGSPTWQMFEIASPNASNSTGVGGLSIPIINPPSGIYSGIETISISADSGTTIYYTTDGSTPSASSFLYTGPFPIDTSQSIRVIATKPGFGDSEIALQSYIFNPSTQLPILHLTIDPMYLFDDQVGMYVTGTNGISGACSADPKNYWQDWEYQANATLYETDNTVAFSEGIGLSMSGGCSRNGNKKSFNVAFKKEFGKGSLSYKLFDSREETTYDGFKLRSGGSYRHTWRIMDAARQKFLESQLDIDHQASRPVVLYLNGEYWGLYNLRDRMNKGFVKTYYNKNNADSLDIIKHPRANAEKWFWVIEDVQQGNNLAYHALDDFMTVNSLANSANYDYVKTQIDMNSFFDYHIANVYYNNADWPGNNLKVWRERSEGSKWRWMMFDLDHYSYGGSATSTLLLDEILNNDHFNNQRNSISGNLMRQLFENAEFEAEFIQRSNTYINTIWESSRVSSIFFDYKNLVASEIQTDYDRWNTGWSFPTWDTNVDQINDFFVLRPDYYRTMLDNTLSVAGRYDLTLNFDNSSNGAVVLHNNHFNVPASYTGTYHDNVPIRIHAVPELGYRFSHWQETGSTDQTLYVSFNTNTTLTPVFIAALDVVINEIHYNPTGSSEGPEFIELFNPDSSPKDLSSFEFAEGVCFEFPEGTIIQPGEYIVIANDVSLYEGNGYQVFQWYQTNLSNGGEHISLVNGSTQVIDSLTYNDGAGWSKTADNGFYSLGLLDPSLDNGVGTSWDVQSVYITPGAQNQFLPYDTYHLPSDIVINEIHYHPFDSITPGGDTIVSKNYEFIELKNLTNTAISLDGVALTRGVVYEFPTGSVLPANGFVVVSEDSLLFFERYNFYPMGVYEGKLSNSGELVWLSDQTGNLLDAVEYDDIFPWDAQADGGTQDYSLALIDPTLPNDTYINWQHQCTTLHTPLAENDFGCFTGQTFAGLTINEIHYAPTGGANAEYIELANYSSTIIQLEGMTFSNGITSTFGNTLMFPGSYVVIARDSTTFHNTYGIAPDGDYGGDLSNTGELIRLRDFFGNLIDQVTYSNAAPWETQASQSNSLALIDKTLDNALASSWCIQDTNITPRLANSFGDEDGDGFVDCIDNCPSLDDSLIGAACNDGDSCTTGEKWDANCNCTGGTIQDSDNDGVCDAQDQCSGINDALIGTACNDADPCTVGEKFDTNCQCTGGIANDSDNDGICDAQDQCPNFDDNLIGQPCDDGIICFVGSTWDSNCQCSGGQYADTDNDGVCDPLDECPGSDDTIDSNGNGIPDGCESCSDYVLEESNSIISQDRSANIAITTNGRVFIEDVEYHGGQEVNLTSGFEVKAGAVFYAYIAPCN